MSATAAAPGSLQLSPSGGLDFGSMAVGHAATKSFSITNAGRRRPASRSSGPNHPSAGRSPPPPCCRRAARSPTGQTVARPMTLFAPTTIGAQSSSWSINRDQDGRARPAVQRHGRGRRRSDHHDDLDDVDLEHAVARRATSRISRSSCAAALAGRRSTLAPPRPRCGSPTRPSRPRCRPSRRSVGNPDGGTDVAAPRSRSIIHAVPRAPSGRRSERLRHRDHAGAVAIPITRIVAAKRLTPGVYRIRSVVHDSSGHAHTFVTILQLLAPPTTRPGEVATLHLALADLL